MEENNTTDITTIIDMCVVFTNDEIIQLASAHIELVPVFWNYYRTIGNYSMMCEMITKCNKELSPNYLNEIVELISANEPDFDNLSLAKMAISVLPHLRYIPESFEEFMLDCANDSATLSCIVTYGSKEFLIRTKITLLTKFPKSIDYFVNYLCSYKYENYDMEDFYKDLPQEYQMGVII